MSGPADTLDAPVGEDAGTPRPPCVEVADSRESTVGDVRVRRALPRRDRRTVGPWCFADHLGPVLVTETAGLDLGPHPHTGLQTVTWLLSGEVLHRDSLGTEQLIRPGQLNLMTAVNGVSHSEESPGRTGGRCTASNCGSRSRRRPGSRRRRSPTTPSCRGSSCPAPR